MTQFIELNLPDYNLNQDITEAVSRYNNCICCSSENVCLIRLITCKHTSFFECFFKYKMEYPDLFICHHCHNILKKIESFKQQVEENLKTLNEQAHNLNNKRNKLHDLKYSKLEITSVVNSQPIEIEIKNEPKSQTDHNVTQSTDEKPEHHHIRHPEDRNITTEVKIEHDSWSDFETDIPLSELKRDLRREDKRTKKKEDKQKRKKRTSIIQEKYEGKIKIIVLTENEMMDERQRAGLKPAYLNLPYKCENCLTGFDHELTLKEHMEKRHDTEKGGFVCNICKSVLSTQTSYKEHAKRHVRRYECVACGKRYNNVYSVLKHYNEQHGKITTQFTCAECGFTTESNRSYRYHRDKHKAKPQCSQCGKTFVNNTGLKTHMFTVHKQSNRIYSCNTCNKMYNAKSGLLAHAASAHGGSSRAAYCAACRAHFRTAHNLRHHLRTHSKHVTETDKRFICDECGAKFLTKASLQEHTDWLHLKNTKYECNKCQKVFKNNSALKKHKNFVHEKKRPPRNKICDHCGRGFTTLAILRSHIRTHTGERPLRCARCPAAFAHSAALYTHNKLLHAANRQ